MAEESVEPSYEAGGDPVQTDSTEPAEPEVTEVLSAVAPIQSQPGVLDPFTCIPKRNQKYAKECTEVYLANQDAETLSDNFYKFPNLEVTWFNMNRLTRLENLESNFRIREVFVQNNRLVSLSGLKNCKFLRVLLASNNVYLLVAERTVLGLLKTGPKKLFVAKGMNDGLVEINPQCVLDFYVVEGKQRAGLGRTLFDAMLMREGLVPEKLAYDRPSPKLLGFLRKHFGLSRYTPQANNFVVFDAYFSGHRRASGSRPQPPLSSPPLEPMAAVRVDPRDLDAVRRQGRPQEIPAPAAVVTAVLQGSESSRDETVAAGMPSGGHRRSSGPTAPLGGRRSNCGNRSDSPPHHAGRSALRPPPLRT